MTLLKQSIKYYLKSADFCHDKEEEHGKGKQRQRKDVNYFSQIRCLFD